MFQIEIERAVPRFKEFQFTEPVSWKINEGENWAVIGPNGAGKTLLTDILQGKIVLKEGQVNIVCGEEKGAYRLIKSMAFRDIYSLADCRNMYYQQRWNSSDSEEAPLAGTLLQEFTADKIAAYTKLFHIDELLHKRIIALSSGELRKFLITRTLLAEPKVLILDNPFIGLDAVSRDSLGKMLQQMAVLNGLQTILVLSNPLDIPEWTEHVLPVWERTCLPAQSREEFLKDVHLINKLFPEQEGEIPELPADREKRADYTETVKMEEVTIKYGNRVILKELDWIIKNGEKWALLGENGSGKSTLLSLVCGDNPQSYANKLTLFDRRRGTGESIWDIKKRIGYLSPDMHTYYLQDIPCIDVVASGFFDSIGLFRKCSEEQRISARRWLEVFNISQLADRSFVKISYGEQRLILLARAFVKNPELLILDEPLHGLDVGKKKLARQVIEAFCTRPDKTLIYVTHYIEEIPSCVTLFKTLSKN